MRAPPSGKRLQTAAPIELEPKWKLGHGASGGRADILIKNNNGAALLLIECKTPGRKFDKAWRNTQQDNDQSKIPTHLIAV
jgi:hypothetical protein